MRKLLFILICFVPRLLFAQQLLPYFSLYPLDYNDEIIQSSISEPQQTPSSCISYSNNILDSRFIPGSGQSTIYIRLNLIFLQRSDGSGNFQENDTNQQAIINDIIKKVNVIYSELVAPADVNCLAGYSFVPNSKIQFVIGEKIFIKDNYGWNNNNDTKYNGYKCPNAPNWYLDYLDNQIVNNTSISRGVNVYFTEDSLMYDKYVINNTTTSYTGDSYSCSQYPSVSDINRTSKVHMLNKFTIYNWSKNILPFLPGYSYMQVNDEWRTSFINGSAINLAHEFVHTLDLGHATACDNLMNPGGGSHNFLKPLDIGHVHYMLSASNLRSFIPVETYAGVKDISTTETWKNMRLYSGLNIASTGQMTFPCNITMPYQSNIQVSGSLTIDNSNINSIQNDWGGIIVKTGGLLVLNTTAISDYNIIVENGGSLIIKGSLSISGNHNIIVKSGGYMCIEVGTSIQLSDYNSLIKINEGALNGVNPSLSVLSSCISNPTDIIISGNGSIIDYSQDVYIQNQTISSNKYIGGKNIFVGNHVTTSQAAGDVLINNSANVIFDCKNIVFDPGFECAFGSTYEVKNH